MIITPTYEVELYIDGVLIGDVRRLAEGLTFTRRRTSVGVDSISFSLNDVAFSAWLQARNTTIADVLRPIALECRIKRNGGLLVGGFLASMPAYSPLNASATLSLNFDGYFNLLAGVYLAPSAYSSQTMDNLAKNWILEADTRASNAGKAFGFVSGFSSSMASVVETFDDYKSVKEAICDRCDNTEGAGVFDVYFHADKVYDIVKNVDFGVERAYTISYPSRINGVSAITVSTDEIQGFASSVLGVGSGETSSNPDLSTVITYQQTDPEMVARYGYVESLLQESSVSVSSTLQRKVATSLADLSNIMFQPSITLSGRQVAPSPVGDNSIWLGDIVKFENSADKTGMMNGRFRVQELTVDVSASGSETITPTLERVADGFSLTGVWKP